MNIITKIIVCIPAMALVSNALAAAPQATSLNQLLEQIRASSSQNSALNRQREQQFLQQSNKQAQILAAAKQALAAEQARNSQLQSSFNANKQVLDGLFEQLHTREGDFSRVFDSVRQAAVSLKTTLDNSLVSAQYPERGVFLARMAESHDLPSLGNLRKLWFLMQQEMTESGMVTKFPASVTREDGTQMQTSVVRIGVFNAISGNHFLQYLPETGALLQSNRQPAAAFRSQAEALYNANSGVLPMPLDPTRGRLLKALVNQPSFMERISQAQLAGWLIIILGIIGVLIVVERGIYLTLVGRRIKAQLASSKPDFNNPLGRILTAFNEARNDDVETLELRMDEAFMKERPVIEARLGFLKIISLIAVLLGLLGTVAGIMDTFQSMNLFSGDTSLIADGIAAALVSTWLGLLVAVILLFCHGLLATRGEALMQKLEEQIAGIIAVRLRKAVPAAKVVR